MSLPNPINITYILTSEVVEYSVQGNDNIININTSSAPISIYLPNIRNSDMLSNVKTICINDGTNNAVNCPITVYACGGDKINGKDFIVLNKSGISVQITLCNISEWACVDLELKLPIETPVIEDWDGIIDFTTDHIYGTWDAPVDNYEMAVNFQFSVSGTTNLIVHNSSIEPIFIINDGNIGKLNGAYVPNVNNFYYLQCISQNYLIYTISQDILYI
jgi:hypothetical protein